MAAESIEGTGPTIESEDGTISNITISRDNVNITLEWTGITSTSEDVAITINARLDGETTFEEIGSGAV